ncbi:hypothetical protein [Emticicia fluvialis]|uniref:hypothetical protein n=1 Tax=Emticicia fluvialis TaxID=2974474 RepID=UPI002165EB98|nr:hypothetical protein [Emticicia fluvialis]
MKKLIHIALVLSFCLLLINVAVAQRITLENVLDETVKLLDSGKTAELAESLKTSSIAVQSEANTRGNEMKEKLLEQSKTLKSYIPMAASGTLKKDVVEHTIATIRLTVAANNINNLLSEGKEGLLGNAKILTRSLGMLKAGMYTLDTKQQSKLNNLISSAAENVTRLDEKNGVAQNAASSAKKTLSKIVDLVKEAI